MRHTKTEEDYLKAIYTLEERNNDIVSTSALAEILHIHAASVTDFIQRMSTKKWISYKKSKGVKLTPQGKTKAIQIIRRHRLWESWLLEKLGFKWDEIHDIAEQLEHIDNELLIEKLDKHLGHPRVDPHGDPIPDAKGNFSKHTSRSLLSLKKGVTVKLIGVMEHSSTFLQYLTKIDLRLGDEIKIEAIEEFDDSFHIKVNGKVKKVLSKEVAKNLLVI